MIGKSKKIYGARTKMKIMLMKGVGLTILGGAIAY